MEYSEFVELMKRPDKRYLIDMGAGLLSKRYNLSITRKQIKEAKKAARKSFRPKDIKARFPKILIFDIETSPSIAYSFQRFNVNLYIDQIVQDPIILTWSAKWLYSADILSDSITKKEVAEYNDSRIVKSLWKLLDEADMVVAHYGDRFDIPMMNSRAILNGLTPPTSFRSIDTKRVASSVFKFPSNKLDALGDYFKVGKKIKTDFDLWKRCIEGDAKAIEEMRVYNVQDVIVLEEVYLKLRPWIKQHPNVGMYMESDDPVCSNCGSHNILSTGKFYYTNTSKFPVYRCKCGALTRGRFNRYNNMKRKTLLMSI